jgi:hypothetical protein
MIVIIVAECRAEEKQHKVNEKKKTTPLVVKVSGDIVSE